MPPDVETTMPFQVGGERAACGNERISSSIRPFFTESEIRAGQSRIRQDHPEGGKADGMGASVLALLKKNGDIRLVIDFRELSKCIIRPNFETATPFQAVRIIPPRMKFLTVIDALKGYHQVPLDDKSIDLTTFSTPFGRYQYLRLPFGVAHAGDDYCRRVSEVFDDLPNCRRIIEDIVVYSAIYEEHVEVVRRLFHRAAAHNVAINTSKKVFAQPAVTFGGYVVDADGFSPAPELTRAIRECPTPGSITDVRSFFGLCQQVGNFSDQLAAALDPLSPLLKTGYT